MLMHDNVMLHDVRRTSDGYLTAKVKVARTGIQKYRGYEVGLDHEDEISVYRPAEQVFRKDSLNSYAHRPITKEHPREAVTADNWKKYAVGQTGGEVARDGDFVTVPLVLMDADIIRDWETGVRKQLSLGYSTELMWDSGVTDKGEKYDAIQTDIRANHLAVVVAARGGPNLRIGDNNQGDDKMTLKTMTIDGIAVEMTDTAAQVVTKMIETLDEKIEKQKKNLAAKDTQIAELTTVSTTKDAEIVTLRKQVEDSKITPDKLDALVKDRSHVVAVAQKLIGDSFNGSGKSVFDMRRLVVDSKLGAAAKGWTDDQVTASFNTLAASANISTDAVVVDRLSTALSATTAHSAQDATSKAYADYEKRLNDAWKPKAVA